MNFWEQNERLVKVTRGRSVQQTKLTNTALFPWQHLYAKWRNDLRSTINNMTSKLTIKGSKKDRPRSSGNIYHSNGKITSRSPQSAVICQPARFSPELEIIRPSLHATKCSILWKKGKHLHICVIKWRPYIRFSTETTMFGIHCRVDYFRRSIIFQKRLLLTSLQEDRRMLKLLKTKCSHQWHLISRMEML